MSEVAIVDEKREGRRFWDANPCGEWKDCAAFTEWIERTEPYAFGILAKHQWTGRRVLEVGCGRNGAQSSGEARRRRRRRGHVDGVHRAHAGGRACGLAIVMLYRTGNPKWWATRSIRGVSRLFDRVTNDTARIAGQLRSGGGADDDRGTALLERRLADMTPILGPFTGLLAGIDRGMESAWGFNQVIEARR